MTSLYDDDCFTKDITNSCYLGFPILLFGLILLTLNLFAFFKMSKYYGKMNFENTILLLSSIQSIFIIVELIINKEVLTSFFIFIQILSMCLIIFKFKKISKGLVKIKYFTSTKIIAIVNIISLLVFITFYTIEKHSDRDLVVYINIFYYILELCTSSLLTYNCWIFLRIIKKYQNSNDKVKNKNNKKVDDNKMKAYLRNNMMGDGLFYLIKKRQLTLLYLGNILCTFFILLLEISINFIIDEDKTIYDYIYYCYFLFSFVQNSINFICFYWLIKQQYNKIPDININTGPEESNENKLIDDKYIEEEIANIGNENIKISGYIWGEEKENGNIF